MAVARVLPPFVRQVAIANPLHVKPIAHARVKTDKVDAGTLGSLFAAEYLPEICPRTPPPSGRAGRLRAAISLSVVIRGSRTKCTRFCTPILFRNVLTLTCSIGRGGHGWRARRGS
jgi:transposase